MLFRSNVNVPGLYYFQSDTFHIVHQPTTNLDMTIDITVATSLFQVYSIYYFPALLMGEDEGRATGTSVSPTATATA